ncbi:MAG: cellulose synthase operon protein YhjQ/BcsQ [Reyranella sp.]|uniref:AAA family ATPase n=1 Tax=Reyranella sp. TaxID=1929291 RepID=UPI0027307B31|nr:cellulose synthase operon protein YhjQ/BcsQ [Reyranella sp.]MDP1964192.1 cellulose synthase operon protein YhjQ/BcsQ [Reyranella sp.]MDP2373707.1 cellulose synthase operon protein YhjQ/BcsQ [Reyranella sp.]
MSATASAQILTSASQDDKPGLSTMAFISDSTALSRVSADLFNITLGKANIREGSIDAALAIGDWPRNLDLLIVDLADALDPIADAAALKTAVPGGCIVIGVGRVNDVALFRDLIAVGFNDYLALPFAEGAMGRAVERALDLRQRTGNTATLGQSAHKDATPRTLSVIGARGGVGATTTAVTVAAMLGARLKEEVLLIDFDLHYGSLMLALDLEAIDALREALDQPDRIDALFIQQVAQKKSEFLYAMGAEEAPTNGFQARPHAAGDFLKSIHRRFRWVVADVPRGDPVMQRQVIEASTDILLVTDLSLPGVRDAMRLQQLVHDVAPAARLYIATGGAIEARRSAVKVSDVERTLKHKVDVQIPADTAAALSAVNVGKPVSEAAPASGIVKALRPLVASLDAPDSSSVPGKARKTVSLFERLGRGLKKK